MNDFSGTPIKVGVLHSLTGTMAISEKPVVDATLLAISEVNQGGGVKGRRIQAVVVDGRSDSDTFKKAAKNLILNERVSVIFGCWRSSCRKSLKAIVEKYNHILVYPVQYEGCEQSPNIIYTGAVPNQQIVPGVNWSMKRLGRRFFLVGSDYIFPRMANLIIKEQVAALGGRIVGEEYISPGKRSFKDIVKKIKKTRPDVILNTINGDENIAFFKALRAANISAQDIPTVSFSIGENELKQLEPELMAGDYAVWSYFQSIGTENNRAFVRNFQAKFGAERTTSDAMEAAYFGVQLWAQAAESANTLEVNEIRKAMVDQTFPAPEGIVYIDPENNHTWKNVRIGKIRKNGQFEIVWSSGKPIEPIPYPYYRLKSEWSAIVYTYYRKWGGKWANVNP